jgi:hypothetical protein
VPTFATASRKSCPSGAGFRIGSTSRDDVDAASPRIRDAGSPPFGSYTAKSSRTPLSSRTISMGKRVVSPPCFARSAPERIRSFFPEKSQRIA